MAEATVEEIAGFISGNVKRKQVLDVLDKNGNKTFDALRKITRMPKIILEKVIKDMTEFGVIEKQNDDLCPDGKRQESSERFTQGIGQVWQPFV